MKSWRQGKPLLLQNPLLRDAEKKRQRLAKSAYMVLNWQKFRVGFRLNGFFADFFLGGAAGCFCGCCCRIFLSLWEKSAQKNPPGKASKIYTQQRFPTCFCGGAGQKIGPVILCQAAGSLFLSLSLSLNKAGRTGMQDQRMLYRSVSSKSEDLIVRRWGPCCYSSPDH